jgi:tRNA (guanine-N7-)-methyltransferase
LAPERRLIFSFGRRRGRRIRAGRQALIGATEPASLDPVTLFEQRPCAVWLEIGFGGGEHLAWQAAARPEVGFIGAEPYINGIASLSAKLEAERLINVRIFPDDGRLFLPGLRPASIGGAFVLFPDPWPKTRHHKRRLIQADFVQELARILVDGAELRIATDDRPYLVEILAVMTASPAFRWRARRAQDWRQRPDDWPATRYERKALAAGRDAAYLSFERLHRAKESV